MKSPQKLYKDSLHGFTAQAWSKVAAWMLIRNACHEQKLKVPTFDQIVEVKTK